MNTLHRKSNPECLRRVLFCLLFFGACRGESITSSKAIIPSSPQPRSTLFACGTSCITIPGPVPGSFSAIIQVRDSATAVDSVAWPIEFPQRTRVRMTVSGRLSRRYTSNMTPSLSNMRGQPYFALDADGEYAASSCNGHIYTAFRLQNGLPGSFVSACSTSANPPAADGAQSFVTVGTVSGSGYVFRWSQHQPTWPGYFNCL